MLRQWIYIQDIPPFKSGDIILADEHLHIVKAPGIELIDIFGDENSNYKYFLTTLTNMRIDIYDYIIPLDIWRNRRINEILDYE